MTGVVYCKEVTPKLWTLEILFLEKKERRLREGPVSPPIPEPKVLPAACWYCALWFRCFYTRALVDTRVSVFNVSTRRWKWTSCPVRFSFCCASTFSGLNVTRCECFCCFYFIFIFCSTVNLPVEYYENAYKQQVLLRGVSKALVTLVPFI